MAPRSRPRAGLKFPIYKDEVLGRIIEAAGGLPEDDREVDVLTRIKPAGDKRYERAIRREVLRDCLEGAAEQCLASFRSADVPTEMMLDNRCAQLEKAGQKVLKILGTPGTGDRITRLLQIKLGVALAGGVPSLEAISGIQLQKYIRSYEELLCSLTSVREKSAGAEPTPVTERNVGDIALDELIRSLANAWFFVFQEVHGSSAGPRGTVRRPFIRFVRAALEPLLETVPADGALRSRLCRVLRPASSKNDQTR